MLLHLPLKCRLLPLVRNPRLQLTHGLLHLDECVVLAQEVEHLTLRQGTFRLTQQLRGPHRRKSCDAVLRQELAQIVDLDVHVLGQLLDVLYARLLAPQLPLGRVVLLDLAEDLNVRPSGPAAQSDFNRPPLDMRVALDEVAYLIGAPKQFRRGCQTDADGTHQARLARPIRAQDQVQTRPRMEDGVPVRHKVDQLHLENRSAHVRISGDLLFAIGPVETPHFQFRVSDGGVRHVVCQHVVRGRRSPPTSPSCSG
eukprot:scaffold1031_cov461-Prasinococcus_capsulatus_cf.AAC.1